ncbi:MAG: hypothetical protein KAI83_06410 [Thiomargarita sp.]|nr:hypothetical protein [Thiomargarita sp.]
MYSGQPQGIAPTSKATIKDCPYIKGNHKGLPLQQYFYVGANPFCKNISA